MDFVRTGSHWNNAPWRSGASAALARRVSLAVGDAPAGAVRDTASAAVPSHGAARCWREYKQSSSQCDFNGQPLIERWVYQVGGGARAGDTLYDASVACDLAAVESMLAANKQPNDTNQCGPTYKKTTPLHEAASRGADRICSVLLDGGALVNAVNSSGHTPLHEATTHLSVVRVLVQYQVDVNAKSKRGRTGEMMVSAFKTRNCVSKTRFLYI